MKVYALALLGLALLLPNLSFADEAAADQKQPAWVNLNPKMPDEAVQRTTDRYPLSDQKNAGHWVKYAPMSDEFKGHKLNGKKWYATNPTWKGHQPSFFDTHNVVVKDGCLQLTMRKAEPPADLKSEGYHTYSSAAVQSKDVTLYGYFEIRAKPMKSAGSSAFWLYKSDPDRWTEIDIFEIGANAPGFENKVNTTLHVIKTPTDDKLRSFGTAWTAPFRLADDFHVYGMEWNEKEILAYVDGALVCKTVNTLWTQALTLNFDSETMPNWFGLPKDEDLPSTYYIDYVRVWKAKSDSP